ncbi:MAG TPA: phosphoribosyltransferase family protein [Methylotenera sp.]|nr:phosphoribosyltransferase family protein [Methylotenera sp.]HPH04503.1 phosphoribosyltransferase family protein [Methylotenera sp.]HPN01167.1 phosphoribosyltransferase family protein [Methylotenera sp.]
MIVLTNKNSKQVIQPTRFPDGTSQVWKLDIAAFQNTPVKVVWHFEEEAELIWVNQLTTLLRAEGLAVQELYMPYLPYARQDKAVSNSSTFAKTVFIEMLFKTGVRKLSTLDAHSPHAQIFSYSAKPYITQAIKSFKPDVLVFPDAGAFNRYSQMLAECDLAVLVLDKNRDQATGEIKALTIDIALSSASLGNVSTEKPVKMLLVDDICDGGATFINAAKYLCSQYPRGCELGLYVTHGIFSKGFDGLMKAGISAFFTTQSLTKNIAAYSLIEIE